MSNLTADEHHWCDWMEECGVKVIREDCICFCLADADAAFAGAFMEDGAVCIHDRRCPQAIAGAIAERTAP